MSMPEISPEQLAELFIIITRALPPDFEVACNSKTQAWEREVQQEKSLVLAARLALRELSSADKQRQHAKRYFAKPGEAEWGC